MQDLDQTIKYYLDDIAKLNERCNQLWDEKVAAEDGSGLAAARIKIEELTNECLQLDSELRSAKVHIQELESAMAPATEPPSEVIDAPFESD